MFYYLPGALAFACALIILPSWWLWHKRPALPYPPGPKGLPMLGNLLDMPAAEEWKAAQKWGEQYGSLVSVKNFGTRYLFLNSYQAAVDLFEKRGQKYSSRPRNVMIELEGWDWFPALMPYGEEFKRARQYIQRFFQQSALGDYYELQTRATHNMLLGFLKSPDEFFEHTRRYTGEIIMMVAYGHKVTEKNDPYLVLADKGVAYFGEAEGFFLVNAIPWLRHLPAWLPGTEFKKIAKEGHKHSMAMLHEPHAMAKQQLYDGSAVPSMTSKLIEGKKIEDGVIDDEALIAKCTGVVYAAGADTIVSVLLTFILAMVLHPEYQRRAQEELDKAVGKDNLPSFEDRPNLPFITAICKECLRWKIVAPWGISHCASEDDDYNGYFIPAGTSVLPNLWAMSRDTKEYPEPDKFDPDRWLPAEGKRLPMEINKIAFGIGRRICPGRYFAENAIFITIASMLSAFNFGKALDEQGVPITPNMEYTTSFIRHPLPFRCSITPRSDKIAVLIRQAVESSK